jgi:hypothetical protein
MSQPTTLRRGMDLRKALRSLEDQGYSVSHRRPARDNDHRGEWDELYDQLQRYCWRWDFATVATDPPAWNVGGYETEQ